jgi:hypothetical protein
VLPRILNFICRRFGTLCSIFIGGIYTAYEDGTVCSETPTHKIQRPWKHPKERIQSKITVLLTKAPSKHFLSLSCTYLLFNLIYCISFTIFLKTVSRIEHDLATNQEMGDFMFPSQCKLQHFLFWDVTLHRLVVTDVSGQSIGPVKLDG